MKNLPFRTSEANMAELTKYRNLYCFDFSAFVANLIA